MDKIIWLVSFIVFMLALSLLAYIFDKLEK